MTQRLPLIALIRGTQVVAGAKKGEENHYNLSSWVVRVQVQGQKKATKFQYMEKKAKSAQQN